MFIDKVTIYLKAGNGGNGCVSFRREKYVPHGGPDGGDGGKGGDVIFVIDEGKNTLLDFKYRRKFIAKNGSDGGKKKFYGKSAENLEIPIPPGTLIKDSATGNTIADMSDPDMAPDGRFVILKGGKGGFGNTHFATPTRQAPNFAKSGIKGGELEVELELKMLADAGLAGMPNAGKSTILSMISAAKPKIAGYPFTTLSPILGVIDAKAGSYVLADIPGLIEGASGGEGLGHEFLRHIDRCRLIVNVVDASGSEGRDPVDDLTIINRELELYNPELAARPRIIAANKSDITGKENRERLIAFARENRCEILFLCAAIGEGTDALAELIAEKLRETPPIKVYKPELPLGRQDDEDAGKISVRVENGVYFVDAERIVTVIESVNLNDFESLSYFQKVLRNSGVIAALEKSGIREGDTVDIYGVEFEYYP